MQAWPFPRLADRARYPDAVLRALRRLRPALVEVQDRPALALRLAARLPGSKVVLVLHNDPQSMRRAHTPARTVPAAAPAGRGGRGVGLGARADAGRGGGPGADPGGRVPSNCIDLAALPPGLPAAAREPVILFAGRTIVEKGADVFVRACAAALPELPGWQAVMLGARGHNPADDAIGYPRRRSHRGTSRSATCSATSRIPRCWTGWAAPRSC